MGFEFGGFRLDSAQRRLFAPDGAAVELPSRAFDVLLFMVERPGQLLDKGAVLKAVWPDTVVEEGNLSRCIFDLRRALGDTASEHRFIATVPGRGYQFVAQVHMLAGNSPEPVASVPSPPAAPVPSSDPGARRGSLRATLALGAALAVGLAGYLLWPRASVPAAATTPQSIAVLPFADLSPAKDMEYFADGIAEELMNSFARNGNLRVVGRRSAFAFKGRNDDSRTIGEKLGVDTLLEGSVRREGDHLRISAQLVRTRDGFSLWSQTYDRQFKDLLDIENSIAEDVVGALAPRVPRPAAAGTPLGASGTHNAEAYNAYLRGLFYFKPQSPVDMPRARDEFLRATQLDPQFAVAHAWLSRSHSWLARRALGDVEQNRSLASAALDRALALDASLADVWWVNGQVGDDATSPFPIRISALKRALVATPDDAEVMLWLGFTYNLQGQGSDALDMFERAYHADPLWPRAISVLAANGYWIANRRQRALQLADELEKVAPIDPRAHQLRAFIAFSEGRALDWNDWNARVIAAAPRNQPNHGYLAVDYSHLGMKDAALYHSRVCRRLNPESAASWHSEAYVRLYSGDIAGARHVVQETMTKRPLDFLSQLAQAELNYFDDNCSAATQAMSIARPAFFQPASSLDLRIDAENVPLLTWCLRRQGNLARAGELATVFERQMSIGTTPGISDGLQARMAAAMGNREALMLHLQAIDQTHSMMFAFVRHEPMIQPWLADREVVTLLDRIDARRAEWRRILPASSTRVPIPGITAPSPN